MKMKEESSFLQGVESRLDSLFAEDNQPIKEKDSDPPQATVQEVASDIIQEDVQDVPVVTDASLHSEVSPDPIQTQDKSSFISEIEKRFSAIFGEDDKQTSVAKETEAPDDLKMIIADAEQEESKKVDQSSDYLSSPPSTVLNSPLKEMKSIILSIEWEINDTILEQLEEEINKLYLLYTGDRIIQGFLRILRFLGRYVRVRGVHSSQDSINLLLFVYDHLENVMVSEGMTESKKHIILIDNIKKYRAWVESTDLEPRKETQVPADITAEVKPPDVEPLEGKFSLEDQGTEIKSSVDVPVAEEPIVLAEFDKVVAEEPFLHETGQEDKTEYAVREPDIVVPTPPIAMAETTSPALGENVENTITAIKDLQPHEAFVYALEVMKKTFQAELDALKEEIRILKSARQ